MAGKAAIAQIQSYMGAILAEFPGDSVIGCLVASDLDNAARSALTVTGIKFAQFQTHFTFSLTPILIPMTSAPSSEDIENGYRKKYWDAKGAIATRAMLCSHCKQSVRAVQLDNQNYCGLCGAPVAEL